MTEESNPQSTTPEHVSPDINRYFKAIPGKTKEIQIGWHDYEDGRSLQKTIHIPIDEGPESGAIGFLMEYVPGMYDFESAREGWRIEVGPVFEGPGPGDGSDAPFDIVTFFGTKEEAEAKGREISSKLEQKLGGWDRDLGSFSVGASVTQRD